MKINQHIGTGQPAGNSHDRRKARRVAARAHKAANADAEGKTVVITTDAYGKRYLRTKATVLAVLEDGFKVQAYRRKAPLEVKAEHVKAA